MAGRGVRCAARSPGQPQAAHRALGAGRLELHELVEGLRLLRLVHADAGLSHTCSSARSPRRRTAPARRRAPCSAPRCRPGCAASARAAAHRDHDAAGRPEAQVDAARTRAGCLVRRDGVEQWLQRHAAWRSCTVPASRRDRSSRPLSSDSSAAVACSMRSISERWRASPIGSRSSRRAARCSPPAGADRGWPRR